MPNRRPLNQRSKHLTDSENNGLIGEITKNFGVTLATAPVQLWLSQKPDHNTKWIKAYIGIICFVKDYAKKSYFFRLYSLIPKLLWEQEMYKPFGYHPITKNFYFFTGDECNVGLNFAFEEDADKFYETVNNKLIPKITKITNQGSEAAQPQNKFNPNHQNRFSFQPKQKIKTKFNDNDMNFRTNNKNNRSQIGKPFNFRHCQHIGQNSTFGLAEDESAKINEFLVKLSIKPTSKLTEYALKYVKENGGLDRFSEELEKSNRTDSALSNKTSYTSQSKPTYQQIDQQQPIPHQKFILPPPTPAPTPPPPPPLPPSQHIPIQDAPEAFQHQSNTSIPPAVPDISKKNSSSVNTSTNDSRLDLLDSIRNFQGLSSKRTIPPAGKSNNTCLKSSSSLVDQLKDELLKLKDAINPSSSDDNDESDSDWQ